MAAKQIIDEINDYFEVIQLKIDRVKKNSDRLDVCVSNRDSNL